MSRGQTDASGDIHVALLRGINVGGQNIIRMSALVQVFERMKFQRVTTYIASGNVIFTAPTQDLRRLEARIEKELAREFGYDVTVVVKTRGEMDAIVSGIRRTWRRPSSSIRYYVMFLRHAIDSADLLDALQPRAGIETLAFVPGALLWAADKTALGKSTVAKRVLVPSIYKQITVRNLNTTMKIAELVTAGTYEHT